MTVYADVLAVTNLYVDFFLLWCVRIVRAVLSNENSVLTVSARLRGEYGQRDVFAGVPCIVNRNGVDRVLELSLTEEERQKFGDSCAILQESYQGLEL